MQSVFISPRLAIKIYLPICFMCFLWGQCSIKQPTLNILRFNLLTTKTVYLQVKVQLWLWFGFGNLITVYHKSILESSWKKKLIKFHAQIVQLMWSHFRKKAQNFSLAQRITLNFMMEYSYLMSLPSRTEDLFFLTTFEIRKNTLSFCDSIGFEYNILTKLIQSSLRQTSGKKHHTHWRFKLPAGLNRSEQAIFLSINALIKRTL